MNSDDATCSGSTNLFFERLLMCRVAGSLVFAGPLVCLTLLLKKVWKAKRERAKATIRSRQSHLLLFFTLFDLNISDQMFPSQAINVSIIIIFSTTLKRESIDNIFFENNS